MKKLAIIVPGYLRLDNNSYYKAEFGFDKRATAKAIKSFFFTLIPSIKNLDTVIFFSGWYAYKSEQSTLFRIISNHKIPQNIKWVIKLKKNNELKYKNIFEKIDAWDIQTKVICNSQYKSVFNCLLEVEKYENKFGKFDFLLKTRFDIIYNKIILPKTIAKNLILFPPVEGRSVKLFNHPYAINDQIIFGQRDEMFNFLSIEKNYNNDQVKKLYDLTERKIYAAYKIKYAGLENILAFHLFNNLLYKIDYFKCDYVITGSDNRFNLWKKLPVKITSALNFGPRPFRIIKFAIRLIVRIIYFIQYKK